jgi:hypothetical protein
MAHRIAEKKQVTPPLRVLARGDAMVPDYAALLNPANPTRRHIGWVFDPTAGYEYPDKKGVFTGGFVKQPDLVVTIPGDAPLAVYTAYVKHLRDGDLWAADAATANAVGVAFEPHFLDEHPSVSSNEECTKELARIKALQEKGTLEAKAIEAKAKQALQQPKADPPPAPQAKA